MSARSTRVSLLRSSLRKLRSASRLPRHERARTLHAFGALALVEFGLRALPLPAVARLAGVRLANETSPGRGATEPQRPERRLTDVRAVDRAIRHWPLRARCLERSLVLGHLWRAEHPVLVIGVAAREELEAHAWIEIDGSAVTGDDAGFVALRRALRADQP